MVGRKYRPISALYGPTLIQVLLAYFKYEDITIYQLA